MNTNNTQAAEQHAAKRRWLNAHEEGYHKAMGNRQVQMIAIGGAIGTGLFLGAGARLQMAGPALALVYLVCGIFSFFILRALGELVLHRPSSGSFVSYAREFLGEKAAYVAGWMYFINWAMTGIVDITAVALYMHYWGAFGDVPQWVFALGALAIVGTMNMIGVKWFAEMEFWFALVKVLAIVIFLVVGTVFLGTGKPLDGNATGFHLITDNGGFFLRWFWYRVWFSHSPLLNWWVQPPVSAKIRKRWCRKRSIASSGVLVCSMWVLSYCWFCYCHGTPIRRGKVRLLLSFPNWACRTLAVS